MQEGAGPRPFDVTTRRLIEADPEGWLAWIGLPADGPVETIESDVSTVLAEVDKALLVNGPSPWIAHVEVQSGRDPILPYRMVEYHALLLRKHLKRVRSTAVLLQRSADGPELSGSFDEPDGPHDGLSMTLGYRVIRLWERPVEEMLTGGIGIMPLATLAATPAHVPDVIAQMDERLNRETSPSEMADLWSATLLLLGLRYDAEQTRAFLRGVSGMRESSTYQAILEEGREEGREDEARRWLLRLGTRRLGEPDARTMSLLGQIHDLETLERLGDDLLTATSWEQLLQAQTR